MGLLLVTNITRGFLVNETILGSRETKRIKAKQSTENAMSDILNRIRVQNNLSKKLNALWEEKRADHRATKCELKNLLSDIWHCEKHINLLTTNLNKLKDNERELDMSAVQDIVIGSEIHMIRTGTSTDGHEQMVRVIENSMDLRHEREDEVNELNELLLSNKSGDDYNPGNPHGGDMQSEADFILEKMNQHKEATALVLTETLPTTRKDSDRNRLFPADRGCVETSLFQKATVIGDSDVNEKINNNDGDVLSFHPGSRRCHSYTDDDDDNDKFEVQPELPTRRSYVSYPEAPSSSSDDEL